MSDDRNASGLAAALAQIARPGAAPEGDAQLDIFEPDTPLPVKAKPRSGPQGGRPKGSMNRTTKEWVDYLLQRYRSPLVALMELYSRSPAELAKELGLYVIHEGEVVYHHGQPLLATGEAFKRQVEAMIAALPYTHQKLPLEIHTNDGQKGGMLIIGELNVTNNYDEAPTFLPAQGELIDVTPDDGGAK